VLLFYSITKDIKDFSTYILLMVETFVELEKILQPEPDSYFTKAVNSTYKYLMSSVNVASTKKDLLLMQSVQGRAIKGWWDTKFLEKQNNAYCYPNTTLEDIFIALDKNPLEIQKQRQEIIDDIKRYINSAFEYLEDHSNGNSKPHNHCITLINQNYEPLGGIEFFKGTLISNPLNILIGAYLGGCMDSAEWRAETDKIFETNMHKGITRAVHMKKLKQTGLTLEELSKLNSYETITKLVKYGAISENDNETYQRGYTCGYIQKQPGYGISDDAAFLGVALCFGIEAAYGLLLMDAIDTWDKSTPKITKGGQDEKIGVGIKERYESIFGKDKFPVSDNDVKNIIYLAAMDNKNFEYYPSCSQRRFVQIDDIVGLSALQSHVVFSRHIREGTKIPPKIKIAFKQVPTDKFYNAFKEKYNRLFEIGRLDKRYDLPNGNGNGNGNY
jgi:hypothetical protein